MSIFGWFRKKEQKGAVYPDSLDIDDLSQLYTDAYVMRMKLDPRYVGSSSVEPSGSIYGQEIYEFVEYGSSGTSKYRDQYGRLVDFSVDDLVVICPYCKSKNNQNNFTCTQCGALL